MARPKKISEDNGMGTSAADAPTGGDKKRAIEALRHQVRKEHGAGAIVVPDPHAIFPHFSTGSLNLDIALGIGGVPRGGRITEIYGPESSGKTLIALSIIKESQRVRPDNLCVFIDMEQAYSIEQMKLIGVDTSEDRLIISQPDSGDQAGDLMELYLKSGIVDVMVLDSVPAMVPQAEIDGSMGDQQMGLQARLIGKILRKLNPLMRRSDISMIFINQLREKIGVVYGNPETQPGGRALKFFAGVRIDVRKVEMIKDGTSIIGHKVKAKVVKNKLSAPFREAEFDIIYNEPGMISRRGEIVDLAAELGFITKSGAFYRNVQGETIGQGREKTKAYLMEHPEFERELTSAIIEKLTGSAKTFTPTEDEIEDNYDLEMED